MTYDPLTFVSKVEIISFAVLGSFVTYRFFNSLYDNLYEPTLDNVVKAKNTHKYYIKIGSSYIQVENIIKDTIKWLLIILILMILYNIISAITKKNEKQNV